MHSMIGIRDKTISNFRMSGSRRASVISSMGADEIAELFEKLFDNLNQFKFTEAREFISKSAKKLPRNVLIVPGDFFYNQWTLSSIA